MALDADEAQRAIIGRIGQVTAAALPMPPRISAVDAVALLGARLLGFVGHLGGFVALLGRLVLDLAHLLRHPRDWPLLEISANLFKVGAKAMPVSALVGFLIGVVLSYLSALQLRTLAQTRSSSTSSAWASFANWVRCWFRSSSRGARVRR